ncbi:hypothetical protein [Chloroflexus sp.]|uniref:hypothetical protein n=1 Tax=Chloroflexus sp. TaxID=1904827 RepID=UPI002588BFE5|nr:hypothetical protein [Chloroflexus sp.]
MVDTLLLPESLEGGVFLLSFAVGWLAISLLSAFFAGERMWWPFIPAGVMAVIGSLILVGEGGMTLLDFLFNRAGWVWPLVLIALGVVLILRKPQE